MDEERKATITHHVCYDPEVCIELTHSEHQRIHHGATFFDKAAVDDAIKRWRSLSSYLEQTPLNQDTAEARDLALSACVRIMEYELPHLLPNFVRVREAIYHARYGIYE